MKIFRSVVLFALAVSLALTEVHAADTSLTEKEAPSLSEDRLAGVIKNEHCIILYYNPDAESRDDGAKQQFGATTHQLGDQMLRSMIALAERIQAPVTFYKVNWQGFKAETMGRITTDAGTQRKEPESPTIVTYPLNSPVAYRFSGTARPDMMPLLVHDAMDYFIHAIRTKQGEYLRGGWMFTDTNTKFVSLTDVRKETREFGSRTETVQVISYVSKTYEGFPCRYERIYSSDNRLLASIEDYGKHGKVGYFDYDRTGKMQYRVKYKRQEEEQKGGAKEQERQK